MQDDSGSLMMSLGMALHRGDTTQSSTHGALLDRTDSEIGHGRSMRKSTGWNTKESDHHTPAHNALASRMLIDQLTPYLHKENEEVNAQVKRL
jgi:hypothetical protein